MPAASDGSARGRATPVCSPRPSPGALIGRPRRRRRAASGLTSGAFAVTLVWLLGQEGPGGVLHSEGIFKRRDCEGLACAAGLFRWNCGAEGACSAVVPPSTRRMSDESHERLRWARRQTRLSPARMCGGVGRACSDDDDIGRVRKQGTESQAGQSHRMSRSATRWRSATPRNSSTTTFLRRARRRSNTATPTTIWPTPMKCRASRTSSSTTAAPARPRSR